MNATFFIRLNKKTIMKLSFTKFSNLWLTLMLCGITVVGFGQVANTLTVNGTDYSILRATDFGGDIAALPFSANATFVDDGDTTDADPDNPAPGSVTDACNGTISNVAGMVAFIDRGDCGFSFKALQAQNASAIAVVICNNEPGDGLIGMTGGDEADQVIVSAWSMSFESCEEIRMDLTGSSTLVEFSFQCVPPSYGPNVVWGQDSGEGDFNLDLNGWEITNDADNGAGWEYVPTPFTIFGSSISSATDCNGYIHIDSWNNETADISGGTGDCPDPCRGFVTSPIIDLSSQNIDGLFLEFDQLMFEFFSSTRILTSRDGGVTFPDTFELNTGIAANSGIISTERVPLAGYTNESALVIRVEKTNPSDGTANFGSYYYWAVDDFRLINEAAVDMRANVNFFATAPSFRTPISQAAPMPFLVDIFNQGNLTATNLQVTVSITEPDGEVVTFNNTYEDLPSFSLNENMEFDELYTPSKVGYHIGQYEVSADGDENDANDVIPFFFEVTEDYFSSYIRPEEWADIGVAEQGTYRSLQAGSIFDEQNQFMTGYIFYVPNGAGRTISNINIGVVDPNNALNPATAFGVYVYAWPVDLPPVGQCSGDERSIVGKHEGSAVLIGLSPDRSEINVPIVTANELGQDAIDDVTGLPFPLELLDNMNYIVKLVPLGATDVIPFEAYEASTDNPLERNFLHGASNLAFENLAVFNRFSGTFYEELTNGTTFDEFNGALIGGNYTVNELAIEITIGSLDTGTEDLNSNLAVTAFPNPTSDNLFLDIKLQETSDVQIELIDISGKVVLTQKRQSVRSERIDLDVSNVPSGMYMLNFRAEEGFKTQRIIIE